MSEDFGCGQRQQGDRQMFVWRLSWPWFLVGIALGVVAGWLLFVYLVSSNWG